MVERVSPMSTAVTKAIAAVLLAVLVVGALGVYYAVHELPRPDQSEVPMQTPSPTLTPTPSPTAIPTQAPTGSVFVASVNILQPYNPSGPTIEITLQNTGNNPMTSLQAILSLSANNYTYIFDKVTPGNPLLPGQNTSQTQTLLNAGFEQNQTYPLEIIGNQQNGKQIDYTAPVTITAPTKPTTTGGNGPLQLSLTLDKTKFNLGEPINLTVTITNISNQTLNYTHTGLYFDFQVYNDTNNLVYQWSNFRGIAQFITIEPLPAGENMSQNFTWQQTCNFNASVQEDQVSAGTYNIVGLTGPAYELQTAPIQITIANP